MLKTPEGGLNIGVDVTNYSSPAVDGLQGLGTPIIPEQMASPEPRRIRIVNPPEGWRPYTLRIVPEAQEGFVRESVIRTERPHEGVLRLNRIARGTEPRELSA